MGLLHRLLALATLTSAVCAAVPVDASTPTPQRTGAPRGVAGGRADGSVRAVRSPLGSIAHAAPAAFVLHTGDASSARLYLPILSKGHPLATCRGGMDEATAVERARSESYMMGLSGPSGVGDAEVIAALRMTAAEHDARYTDDGSILEDTFPAGPPWTCYWRIELRGDGILRAGRPGSGPIRINRSMELFPAETCDQCTGMGWYWCEDEGTGTPGAETPGAEATSTADAASATVPVWATPTVMAP